MTPTSTPAAPAEHSTPRPSGSRAAAVAGSPGRVDPVRRRAEDGLRRGLPADEAALLRGMVLGQDQRLTGRRADDVPALRARAPARGQRPERDAAGGARAAAGAARRRSRCALGCWSRWRSSRSTSRSPGRPVDPARRGDGRGGARRGARGPARVALVRARARRGGHARAQPGAAEEPGWQLSFAAVGGPAALAPPLREGTAAAGASRRSPTSRVRSRRRSAPRRCWPPLRGGVARRPCRRTSSRRRRRAGHVARHARRGGRRRSPGAGGAARSSSTRRCWLT